MSEGSEPSYERENKNEDYYQNESSNYDSFNNEEPGMMQGNQSFGRGRGAWRGGGGNRGGRGHFDNNFGGNRGGMQRFQRGGPRGFGNNRGGGPRGPGGFHGNRGRFRGPGPGHHDMGSGGGWNGPPPGMGPKNPDENVWAEARSPDGKIYFYHTITRETTWDRPEGPNVRIVRHDEWTNIGNKNQNPMDQGGGYPGPNKDQMQQHPPQNFPGPMGPPPGSLQGPPPNFQNPPPGFPGNPPPNQNPNLGLPPQNPMTMQGPPPLQGQINSPASGPPGTGPSQPPPGTLPPQSQGPPDGAGRPLQAPGENGMLGSTPPGVESTNKPKGPSGEGPPLTGPPPTASIPPINPINPPPINMSQLPPPGMPPPFGGGIPPGFPPVMGHPGLPPPFLPPPPFMGQSPAPPFAVPPPWGMGHGMGLPPVPVPPPAMQEQLALSQIDPKLVAKAYEWSEHQSPDGKPYFFNSKTQASVWEKPSALIEFEAAKLVVQQRLSTPVTMPTPGTAPATQAKEGKHTINDKTESSTNGSDTSKVKETKPKREKRSSAEKCRPVSSTPVPGTPWCVVWTGDKRVFFYNPSNKTSVWEKPQDLIGRYDVEELLKGCPDAKSGGKVKKVEATSTTSPLSDADKIARETNNGQSSTIPTAVATKIELGSNSSSGTGNKDEKAGLARRLSESDKDDQPPTKKSKNSDTSQDKSGIEVITIGGETVLDDQDDEMKNDAEDKYGKTGDKQQEVVKIETKDGFKEMTALEAEVKAARERAVVPLETRLKKFRDMLIEKQVSAFSTWEKELHKIVFDPRYLILNSKERKSTFESFVKERAEEERKEKKKHMKHVKEQFFKFLEQVHATQKMSYSEFSQKYGRDERYRSVEKARDREQFFNEYLTELKRKEKEERASKKERAKEDLTRLLQEKVKDYHMKWPEVKKKLDQSPDSRIFEVLENEEKEEIFRVFQKKLKAETKLKEKRKKKEKKEKEKEKKAKEKKEKLLKLQDERGTNENVSSIVPSEDRDEISPDEDEEILQEDPVTKNKVEKEEDLDNDKSSEGKVDDISEEEEGCITDDTDDELRLEREKKERAEASMREREREVQRTLAGHLRDRDKEREFYRHEEAVQEFQALLTDLIRNIDVAWKEAKKLIKKDRRWSSVSILTRDEMEELFIQHGDNISRKKKLRFRELLDESRVKPTTTWKDIKKRIKDDPRYMKYSSSERKCEREFEMYLKDMSASMKGDFRNLLKETKTLTFKTKQQIREQPSMMKDIESLLSKDKRYLNLDGMSDERHRLLLEYLDDLERKGVPPPPTASEPNRERRLKA